MAVLPGSIGIEPSRALQGQSAAVLLALAEPGATGDGWGGKAQPDVIGVS
jgi:hypothetical protein